MDNQWKGPWPKFGPQPSGFEDHLVQSPHGVPLGVRIWRPQRQATDTSPAGFVLWLHGGSTVVGSPYCFPPWIVPEFTARNCFVVSAGYRLTPQVGLENQLDDAESALKWCRANLPRIYGEYNVNVEAWAVGGESAGARLATLLALRTGPPPRVVLDLYGHTTYYPQHVLEPLPPDLFVWNNEKYPIGRVIEAVKTRDPSKALVHVPYYDSTEEEFQNQWSYPEYTYTEEVGLQRAIQKYYKLSKSKNHHALRLDECKGQDEKAARINKYSLLHLLQASKSYPPTVVMHGLADITVDPQMSKDLEQQLTSMDVPVLAIYEEYGPHGFDFVYSGKSVEGYDRVIVPAVKFTVKHLFN